MKFIYIFFAIIFFGNVYAQIVSEYESFNNCSEPNNWKIKTVNGAYGFNLSANDQSYGYSNGCMFSYKQTDVRNTSRRTFHLLTKEFTLQPNVNYYLVFSYKFIKPATATFSVSYTGSKGKAIINIPVSNEYVPYNVPISSLVSLPKIQFTFEYDAPGNDLGNQVYFDDILLIADNADCSRAQEIKTDLPALYGHSMPYSFLLSGGQSCAGDYVSAIWYKYVSDYSGLIEIVSNSEYNNNINIFEGSCSSLSAIQCSNKDEFGFTGESLEINVSSGKTYFIKLSKKINDFGKDNGLHSIAIRKMTNTKPKPVNDICNQVMNLTVNQACIKNNNYNAEIGTRFPASNLKSRADVWFKFVAGSNKPHQFVTHADFAEVIALYKGSCTNLQEVQVEDFGNKMNFTPVVGTEYFIQVSGYFSTIEGNLCAELIELNSTKPTNDECINSVLISLNTSCSAIQFNDNNKSTKKPSCVVYHAPDVWYKFIATAEKEVVINIDAGFMYSYGVYEGVCNNLIELTCSNTIDPCDGGIKIKGLIEGKSYFLQILASSVPLKPGEGSLCVRIDEPSKISAFEKLRLSLVTECLHGVLTTVKSYQVTGGEPTYNYYGPTSKEFFKPGEDISAFVEDSKGCRSFSKTEALCNGGSKCKNSNLSLNLSLDCIKDQIGRQTGEVELNYSGLGGSGAYYYYGEDNGIKLKDGEEYQVILIDSDSCFVIKEGRINCPVFTCAQSQLKIASTYDCIDTLLKARLNISVSGALGNVSLSGNVDGELLDQNASFNSSVVDEAGCMAQSTGFINCKFDSCAYARPDLQVGYKCLTDSLGVKTGKAEILVIGSSKAGGEQFTGNQPGDILNHGEKYKVKMKDAFGCSLIREGEINCVITQISNTNIFNNLLLFPNPTLNNTQLFFSISESSSFNLNLISTEGKVISNQNYNFGQGDNSLTIETDKLGSGIYYIQLSAKKGTEILKLVKM
ncbi:MAG: T9SS type A sorting domain-containing protein [Saprospiraceae bacterium]|nr:T9SS type A sorting domain-containing protein [Saprospiraceae bacterium]